MYRAQTVSSCTASPLLHKHSRRLLSSHQGNISTVRAKNRVEQMAPEWLKPPTMVPTTSISFYPTLPHLLTISLPSPPCSHAPIVWIRHPSPLQCHPGSVFLPERLRLTGSPTVRRKVSQEKKERREKKKWVEERWKHFEPFCIFSHVSLKISVHLHPERLPHMLKCQTQEGTHMRTSRLPPSSFPLHLTLSHLSNSRRAAECPSCKWDI